jgi:hypothetical protein
MARFALVTLALALAACSTTPTDSSACSTIAAQAQQLTATLRSCRGDEDCVAYPSTACGLVGECGAAISSGARGQLDQLIHEWRSDCPILAQQCGDCPAPPTAARCRDGVCVCAGGSC